MLDVVEHILQCGPDALEQVPSGLVLLQRCDDPLLCCASTSSYHCRKKASQARSFMGSHSAEARSFAIRVARWVWVSLHHLLSCGAGVSGMPMSPALKRHWAAAYPAALDGRCGRAPMPRRRRGCAARSPM
jgi:hypothetical protein